jgi:hypothetical protein
MDEGYIGTYSPQEDEFAALLLGEPSLYRAFIDPRRIDELTEMLEVAQPHVSLAMACQTVSGRAVHLANASDSRRSRVESAHVDHYD